MPKCLECKVELNSSAEIIHHTCAAYPPRKDESWLDNILNRGSNE